MGRVLVGWPDVRRMMRVCIAFTLMVSLFALPGTGTVSGQESTDCEVTDLGTLSDGALEAVGRWTTADCDSRFRAGSDAHTYRFTVATPGRVRISLTSAGADAYLYLLADDGSRIADNDDGGARIDARVERDLPPGTYLIEATTAGGRSRGPADFAVSVSYVDGCEPEHLGTLQPGADLTASGSWTLDTCGSRFVVQHPAHGYTFNLEQAGRVRIDLKSEDGDPVLSLASLSGGIIGANDDGGEFRNSRIDQYLQAGGYFIEATTYLERDYQPLRADFNLTVHLVDEQAEQKQAQLKIEIARVPPQVVAGDPFPVHYRAGNVGGDLARGGYAVLYVVGPRVFERLGPVSGHWQAGVSYHTGSGTASAGSTSIDDLSPFEVTFHRPGPTWVFVAVVTYDRMRNEIGFHGLWNNLIVMESPIFDPVDVQVDGAEYTVFAVGHSDGEVTTEVIPAAGPDAGVDPQVRLKAIYAAGVRTQLLADVFERPGIAALSEGANPAPVTVADLSTNTLQKAFAQRYASVAGASGVINSLAAGEALNPIVIEDSVLRTANAASSEFAWMASSWRSLQRRIDSGAALSFQEALEAHSQVAYAESVVAAAVAAGDVVTAARAAEKGWQDAGVREMMADQTCYPRRGRASRRARGSGHRQHRPADRSRRRNACQPTHSRAGSGQCTVRGGDGPLREPPFPATPLDQPQFTASQRTRPLDTPRPRPRVPPAPHIRPVGHGRAHRARCRLCRRPTSPATPTVPACRHTCRNLAGDRRRRGGGGLDREDPVATTCRRPHRTGIRRRRRRGDHPAHSLPAGRPPGGSVVPQQRDRGTRSDGDAPDKLR